MFALKDVPGSSDQMQIKVCKSEKLLKLGNIITWSNKKKPSFDNLKITNDELINQYINIGKTRKDLKIDKLNLGMIYLNKLSFSETKISYKDYNNNKQQQYNDKKINDKHWSCR